MIWEYWEITPLNVALSILSLLLILWITRLKKNLTRKESQIDSQNRDICELKNKIFLQEENEQRLKNELDSLRSDFSQHQAGLERLLKSNLTAIPWLAGMIADYLTADFEIIAKNLDWGANVQRAKKVASIREIRAEAKRRIEEAKAAIYQFEYLKQLYPGLEDVLETDFNDLHIDGEIPDHDPTRDYLTKEEWSQLSKDERDQLALDRYVQSRKKSNWQIGRDYELSVAFEYFRAGYSVDTFGSYKGLSDLGRDLIAQRGNTIHIVQCKYWSKNKTIHEKHIFQLFGTVTAFKLDHKLYTGRILPVFVTNISLSAAAKAIAQELGVYISEYHEMVDFPRIKCNIGRDEFGETKIYHLPMDSQYDITQIKNKGEMYAFTVKEAVDHGFRRAYKWHGQ